MLAVLCLATAMCTQDYRPTFIDAATSSYQLDVISWELANLPDKWFRRLFRNPASWFGNDNSDQIIVEVEQYFAKAASLSSADVRLVTLLTNDTSDPELNEEIRMLQEEQVRLRADQDNSRVRVEEALESAVADALRSLGFGSAVGIFPPVDTVLTGTPTVLITSPRNRIERAHERLLEPGLTPQTRDSIESRVEQESDLSALVVDTGGIAFFPSISQSHHGVDIALETIAHEWVHHWLWFRPLGSRYFQGGELVRLNETVADVVGQELGRLARYELFGKECCESEYSGLPPAPARAAAQSSKFDFQAEMRITRVRVDELLANGAVDEAEAYMEERRRLFVANGYPIRRLNQAYFAFHGSYGTTGAAGIDPIGPQIQELRRRSESLEDFLRVAAEFTSLQELNDYLATPEP